ncbi:MAG: OsmC family protein [Gilvibacter sp.]
MKVSLKRVNGDYGFVGMGKSGDPIAVGDVSLDGVSGASPMELLLMSIGACSAVDIVSILNKQRQQISNYAMEVSGERHEIAQAKPFKSAHVKVILEGEIKPEKAKKAAALSFDKYCSVSLTLEPQVPVTYSIEVNGVMVD